MVPPRKNVQSALYLVVIKGPGVVLHGADCQDYLGGRFSHQISRLLLMYGFLPVSGLNCKWRILEYVCLKMGWLDVRSFAMKEIHVQVVWVGRIQVQVMTRAILCPICPNHNNFFFFF